MKQVLDQSSKALRGKPAPPWVWLTTLILLCSSAAICVVLSRLFGIRTFI